MTFIFRPGDSRRAKQVTVVFIVIMAFTIYGGLNLNNFLPSASVRELASILGGLVTVFAAVALWRYSNPNVPYNNFGPIRRALVVGAMAMAGFGFGWMATFGVSCAIISAGAQESSVEAVVESVYRERRGRGCAHRLQLRASHLSTSVAPCVSEEAWKKAKVGVPVTLVVASGALGTLLVDVKLIE